MSAAGFAPVVANHTVGSNFRGASTTAQDTGQMPKGLFNQFCGAKCFHQNSCGFLADLHANVPRLDAGRPYQGGWDRPGGKSLILHLLTNSRIKFMLGRLNAWVCVFSGDVRQICGSCC